MKAAGEQMEILSRGADEIIIAADLEKRIATGKPLRVKVGFDPTAPDLHLGHAVLLTKMRQFQDLGHTVVFLIGDFTALIGDPSGRNTARPVIDRTTIDANAETYTSQVYKILDKKRTEVRRNSEWMGSMSAADLVGLAQSQSLARMLERDDFARRLGSGRPIMVHEVLYPLVQGYDSVALKCDVELGGTDQKFNLLVGRELQRRRGMRPQSVLTVPLLEGLDGKRKMSKSLGNYVAFADSAYEVYAKIMSLSDELMWRYFELLSLRSGADIAILRSAVEAGGNPRDAKDKLAFELAERLHSKPAAASAREEFAARFSRREIPADIEQKTVPSGGQGSLPLAYVLKMAGLAGSTSEARRAIAQGGVRLDGRRVDSADWKVDAGQQFIAQIGRRRFCRISVID